MEICYQNTWGLISDQDWDNNDAKVVCRQLGYNTEGICVYYITEPESVSY